jgi:hypothetical protein
VPDGRGKIEEENEGRMSSGLRVDTSLRLLERSAKSDERVGREDNASTLSGLCVDDAVLTPPPNGWMDEVSNAPIKVLTTSGCAVEYDEDNTARGIVSIGSNAAFVAGGMGCEELLRAPFAITHSPSAAWDGPIVLFRLHVANKGL